MKSELGSEAGVGSAPSPSLSRFVWRYRKAVLLLIGLLCGLGVYSAGHLPIAIFPNLTVPRIIVTSRRRRYAHPDRAR